MVINLCSCFRFVGRRLNDVVTNRTGRHPHRGRHKCRRRHCSARPLGDSEILRHRGGKFLLKLARLTESTLNSLFCSGCSCQWCACKTCIAVRANVCLWAKPIKLHMAEIIKMISALRYYAGCADKIDGKMGLAVDQASLTHPNWARRLTRRRSCHIPATNRSVLWFVFCSSDASPSSSVTFHRAKSSHETYQVKTPYFSLKPFPNPVSTVPHPKNDPAFAIGQTFRAHPSFRSSLHNPHRGSRIMEANTKANLEQAVKWAIRGIQYVTIPFLSSWLGFDLLLFR
jgi:hypothetical protein